MSNSNPLSDYYRGQAQHLRRMAEQALHPEIRDAYLRVAHKWESMADDPVSGALVAANGLSEFKTGT